MQKKKTIKIAYSLKFSEFVSLNKDSGYDKGINICIYEIILFSTKFNISIITFSFNYISKVTKLHSFILSLKWDLMYVSFSLFLFMFNVWTFYGIYHMVLIKSQCIITMYRLLLLVGWNINLWSYIQSVDTE